MGEIQWMVMSLYSGMKKHGRCGKLDVNFKLFQIWQTTKLLL